MALDNPNIALQAKGICKFFYESNASKKNVLENVNITIERGKIHAILGKSGCGKSTLLEILAGLIPKTSGDLNYYDDRPGSNVLVFQQYDRSLLPHLNVFGNVKFALNTKQDSDSRKNKYQKVENILKTVGLWDDRHSQISALSGGMKQRVAIARSLVIEPATLLMDEPFGSLDAMTRYELEGELVHICKELNIGVAFVTHDLDSALSCADEISILKGSPAEVSSYITLDSFEDKKLRHRVEHSNYSVIRDKICLELGLT